MAIRVPNIIRNLREQRGERQEDLAQQLGVDRTTIAKWESGGAVPDDMKMRILRYYGFKAHQIHFVFDFNAIVIEEGSAVAS